MKSFYLEINRSFTRKANFLLFNKVFLFSIFLSSTAPLTYAQTNLGTLDEILTPYVESNAKSLENKNLEINISKTEAVSIKIESNNCQKGDYYLFGKVDGRKNATFFLRSTDHGIEGKLIDYVNKEAYILYANEENEVLIEEVNIHSQVCIMDNVVSETSNAAIPKNQASGNPPQLESFPGAPGVVYLDFDGEKVSGGGWGTIDAAPSGASDAFIEETFYVVAENYAPFNINVTTIRKIYDDANAKSRQMIIYNTTYPDNPGVALFNSFNNGSGDPCWVKMGGPVANGVKAGNVGTHEAGHTLGLKHDGSPAGEYYAGHEEYRVIMGTVSNGYAQWSKGEYKDANNKEDDYAAISGTKNNVGYRTDDHGNDISGSTDLEIENDGEVKEDKNFGIIEKATDLDVFKMKLISGTVNLTVRPADKYDFSQSLDVKVRLLNAAGDEIASVDANSFDPSTINEEISTEGEETYYLEIDGVGKGDPLTTGYTDYGSTGQFFISGKVPINGTGINNSAISVKVQIFPSPAKTAIFVKHSLVERAAYTITSLHGQTVSNGIVEGAGRSNKIDVSKLKAGIYLFKLVANDATAVSKFVIE